MSYQVNLFRKPPVIGEVVSRAEYREILLARMAAGDLYASETLPWCERPTWRWMCFVKNLYTKEIMNPFNIFLVAISYQCFTALL